jgi:hypothetical protein
MIYARAMRARFIVSALSFGLSLAACSGASSEPPTAPAIEEPPIEEPADPQSPAEPDGEEPPAAHGKRAPCKLGADQLCNDDPSVSALWGRCTELGVCECNPGFERSPTSDLCRPVQ